MQNIKNLWFILFVCIICSTCASSCRSRSGRQVDNAYSYYSVTVLKDSKNNPHRVVTFYCTDYGSISSIDLDANTYNK